MLFPALTMQLCPTMQYRKNKRVSNIKSAKQQNIDQRQNEQNCMKQSK